MTMKYSRMVIGETCSDEQTKEFARIVREDCLPAIQNEPGFVSSQLLIEDHGRLTLLITTWDSRDNCLRYHSSRVYRQMVAKTQHLLVGEFVVKLFVEPTAEPVSA